MNISISFVKFQVSMIAIFMVSIFTFAAGIPSNATRPQPSRVSSSSSGLNFTHSDLAKSSSLLYSIKDGVLVPDPRGNLKPEDILSPIDCGYMIWAAQRKLLLDSPSVSPYPSSSSSSTPISSDNLALMEPKSKKRKLNESKKETWKDSFPEPDDNIGVNSLGFDFPTYPFGVGRRQEIADGEIYLVKRRHVKVINPGTIEGDHNFIGSDVKGHSEKREKRLITGSFNKINPSERSRKLETDGTSNVICPKVDLVVVPNNFEVEFILQKEPWRLKTTFREDKLEYSAWKVGREEVVETSANPTKAVRKVFRHFYSKYLSGTSFNGKLSAAVTYVSPQMSLAKYFKENPEKISDDLSSKAAEALKLFYAINTPQTADH